MPLRLAALVAVALFSSAVSAAEPSPVAAGAPGHWSIATGETVSPDRDAIAFEMGWPGITFGYLHGLSDRSDFGFKIDLLYSLENTNTSIFGAGADIPLRIVVNRHEKVSLGLHIDPGARLYTKNSVTNFLTRFPVGGTLGVQATPELRISASADLTMGINWTHTTYFEIGPQFGFGAEYSVDKNLLIGLKGSFGPQFYTFAGSPTDFAFTTEVVVGYRM
jgi:opacity protein-like surface antigen